jgi:osmotically inducible protein OsmC
MALSAGLARKGTPPERLEVTATVTFDKIGDSWTVVSSDLEVKGKIPGIDQEGFRVAAEAAKDGCPISRALRGNVALTVKPSLL